MNYYTDIYYFLYSFQSQKVRKELFIKRMEAISYFLVTVKSWYNPGRVSGTPVSTHRMPEAPRQPPALGRPDRLQTSPRIPRGRSTELGYAAPLTSQPLRSGALVPVCLSGSGTSRNIHPETPHATRGQPPFPAEPLSGAGSVDLELVRVTRAPKTHICGALVLNPAALF